MFIGFPERRSVVRENMYHGVQYFPINHTLHSLRKSEIVYPIVISVTDSTARVTDTVGVGDAAFGRRNPFNILVGSFTLSPGQWKITGIRVFIVDDIDSEDNESFTLRVSREDVGGIRRNFECYDDGEDLVEGDYFCSHTITIIDEDGQFHCIFAVYYLAILVQIQVYSSM